MSNKSDRKYSSSSRQSNKKPCKSGSQSMIFPKVSIIEQVQLQGQGCNNCGQCNQCNDNIQIVSQLPSDAYPVPGCSDNGPIEPRRSCYQRGYINRDCEEATGFRALITQTTGLKALSSSNEGSVQVLMRRKNRVVTLQWEPFTCQLGASGLSYLTINQSIMNLPPYVIEIPIRITYNGLAKTTFFQVDPFSSEQMRIYLDVNGLGTGNLIGDTVVVQGTPVSWIAV